MQHYETNVDVKLYAMTDEELHDLLQIQREVYHRHDNFRNYDSVDRTCGRFTCIEDFVKRRRFAKLILSKTIRP